MTRSRHIRPFSVRAACAGHSLGADAHDVAGNRIQSVARPQSRPTQSMGQLTTHVLDTHSGCPAAGVRIELRSCGPGAALLLATCTQGSGRPAQPLLTGAQFRRGRYELCFAVGEYFRSKGVALGEPAFLERVVVDIGIADVEQHYHVPLLMTPWSYAVYRGS